SLRFFLMLPPPPCSTLFPYTTLFRSLALPSLLRRRHFGAAARRASRRLRRLPRADADQDARRRPPAAVDRRGDRAHRHRGPAHQDRKSTRLNSSHVKISYAVFCLKKK